LTHDVELLFRDCGKLFSGPLHTVDVPLCQTVGAFNRGTVFPVPLSIAPPSLPSRRFVCRAVFTMDFSAKGVRLD